MARAAPPRCAGGVPRVGQRRAREGPRIREFDALLMLVENGSKTDSAVEAEALGIHASDAALHEEQAADGADESTGVGSPAWDVGCFSASWHSLP